jgi:hypothetical protein
VASFPLKSLFHAECSVSTSLRVIATSTTRSGTTCGRWLDAPCNNHVDLALQLVVDLVCRNLGSFVLCVNLTTNSGEPNNRKETGVARQFFFRRPCVRQCEADDATAGEINT